MYKLGMMTEYVSRFGDTNFCLDTIKKLGFDCADLTLYGCRQWSKLLPEFLDKNYKENILKIKEHAKKIGFQILQAHAPFHVYKEGDDEYNKNMFFQLERSIEICGLLNIPKLVIHPWNDWTIEENKAFYEKLLPLAEKNNVIICSENMWNCTRVNGIFKALPCACSLTENFKEQIDAVNSPYLKACVDVGHAQMFSYLGVKPETMIEEMGNRVSCLHLHDNNSIEDEHKIPYTGDINWEHVIKSLRKINYKGDLIIETCLPEQYDTFEKSCEYWKKQLLAGMKLKRAIMDGQYHLMENENGLKLTTTNLGASLYEIIFNDEVMTFNVENKDEFFRDKLFFGKTIGRFANRIPGNEIVVEGHSYLLEDNGNGNVLHGGQSGISTKVFDTIAFNEDKGDYYETKYSYISPELESGFPGELKFDVTYKLFKKENRIDLIFTGETRYHPTPFSPTNHAYFCLGDDSNLNLELKINASNFLLTQSSNLLPIEKSKVYPCLDFRNYKVINNSINDPFLVNHISNGYDHYFYFDNVDSRIIQVSLRNNKYQLDIKTDYEGLQIYSDNYESNLKSKTTNKTIHRGLALEPGMNLTDLHFLYPGEKKENIIIYLFKRR